MRESSPVIREIKQNSFNLERYVSELMKDISPLMILTQGEEPNVAAFILQTEKLFGYVLDRRLDRIDKIRDYVQKRCANILQKDNLEAVRFSRGNIMLVLQHDFWDDLTFDDVEFMVRELAPLMKYYEPDKKKVVQIDALDVVLSRETFVKEIKEDTALMEFLAKNPFVERMRQGKCITSLELKELEVQLSALKPEITIENIQKYQNKDFIVFLHEIIGLSNSDDPKVLIELKFDEFIIGDNIYNSRQLEFLGLLKKVFADWKYIELTDMGRSPLSDEHPLDYFQIGELESIVSRCNEIKVC